MHIPPGKTNLAWVGKLQFYKEKTTPVQKFQVYPLAAWPFWPILQFYMKMHTPLLNQIWQKWLNYSSTEKRQLLFKIFDFGDWPLGHFGQFYHSTGICTYPLTENLTKKDLAKVAKLQFYKQKTAPIQKFRVWPLGHFGQFYNSTGICTHPCKNQIWPKLLN